MIEVKCLSNRGNNLSRDLRPSGVDDKAIFPLVPGDLYPVLAMILTGPALQFLVPDGQDGAPCFAPAGLFDLGTWSAPTDWHFAIESGVRASGREQWLHPWVAAWGYDEFVNDPDHPDALMEGDESALEVFYRELQSIKKH